MSQVHSLNWINADPINNIECEVTCIESEEEYKIKETIINQNQQMKEKNKIFEANPTIVNYSCPIGCDEKFNSVELIKMHLMKKHKHPETKQKNIQYQINPIQKISYDMVPKFKSIPRTIPKNVTTPMSKNDYNIITKLNNPLTKHSSKFYFICPINGESCTKSFKKSNIKKHLTLKHKISKKLQNKMTVLSPKKNTKKFLMLTYLF